MTQFTLQARAAKNCKILVVWLEYFQKLLGRRLFFISFSLSLSAISLHSIDSSIYFSAADLDRMSRMFSLVLSPKFYRGRTSIVISLFDIHFPVLPPVSRSVTLLSPFALSPYYPSAFLSHSCRTRTLVLSLVLSLVSVEFDAFSCSFV